MANPSVGGPRRGNGGGPNNGRPTNSVGPQGGPGSDIPMDVIVDVPIADSSQTASDSVTINGDHGDGTSELSPSSETTPTNRASASGSFLRRLLVIRPAEKACCGIFDIDKAAQIVTMYLTMQGFLAMFSLFSLPKIDPHLTELSKVYYFYGGE